MTTTAATTNTSASASTPPKNSPGLHDYEDEDDDVDNASKSSVEQQQKPEHNHTNTEQKCQTNLERSPPPEHQQQPPPPQLSPPSQNKPHSPSQPQPIDIDVSDTPISDANPGAPSTPTTISSNPAPIVNDTQTNHQLEQSTSSQQQLQQSTASSSNNSTEQKRPMNAFLLFCKRQRSLVKEKYPNLENRGITKILGDWWSKLDKEQKSKYTDLARQHKEAFMKANPDFKWCKTPNVSNINNNISINDTDNESCNNLNSNQHQQQQLQHSQKLQQNNRNPSTATNAELLSLQSTHHPMEVVHSSNSMDIMLKSRQQLEAPKPPKKRFLERNDSVYTNKNSYGPNHNDANSHGADVVPYISLDQDFLDRVIDKAFSEDSSSSPSGVNSCKCSNRNTTNLTTTSNNTTSFSSTSTSSYNSNIDEPVDFSMNRTINATSQQIINNLVEKMLSEGPDNNSSFSKMNGTDSIRPQLRPPVRRDNLDDT